MNIKLEHVAIWVEDLDKMTEFYENYLKGNRNEKYFNPTTGMSSYFITFEGGARLELMHREDIPDNENDVEVKQHLGLIHLAFQLETRILVDEKCDEFKRAGIRVLRGPRVTGDGYYEFEALDPEGNRIEVTAKGAR